MSDKLARRGVFLLFLFCALIEIRFTADSIRRELHITERAAAPFTIKTPGRRSTNCGQRRKPLDSYQATVRFRRTARHPGHSPVMIAIRGHLPGDIVDVEERAAASPTRRK